MLNGKNWRVTGLYILTCWHPSPSLSVQIQEQINAQWAIYTFYFHGILFNFSLMIFILHDFNSLSSKTTGSLLSSLISCLANLFDYSQGQWHQKVPLSTQRKSITSKGNIFPSACSINGRTSSTFYIKKMLLNINSKIRLTQIPFQNQLYRVLNIFEFSPQCFTS